MMPKSACIKSEHFGTLPDGRSVEAWTVRGEGGMELEVLTLGGIVSKINVPDRDGVIDDVVLGYDTLDEYLSDRFFMGVTAGRVAGRISDGKLEVDGESYALPINDSPNHLHGGNDGFHSRLWTAKPIENADGSVSLELCYNSPAGECGYPGDVVVTVLYTVTADNAFIFETSATSSATTPLCLTHHSYFNLSGAGSGSILEHELQISSEATFASDETMTLLDRLIPVDGAASDFREQVKIGDRVESLWQEHGDLYWMEDLGELRPFAKLYSPASGRILTVESTQTSMQAYFSAALDGSVVGKSKKAYAKFGAICLECQGYPQANRVEGFGDILLRPLEIQQSKTIYQFSHD